MSDASDLASQILFDMWEYGRLVLILVIAGAAHGYWTSKSDNDSDRSKIPFRLVMFALSTVGVFVLFAFVNRDAADIIALMKIAPAWGSLTSIAILSTVILCGITGYRYLVEKRTEKAISISGTYEPPPPSLTTALKVSWSAVVLSFVASTVWLWHLRGR
jgi:hypothetical protein